MAHKQTSRPQGEQKPAPVMGADVKNESGSKDSSPSLRTGDEGGRAAQSRDQGRPGRAPDAEFEADIIERATSVPPQSPAKPNQGKQNSGGFQAPQNQQKNIINGPTSNTSPPPQSVRDGTLQQGAQSVHQKNTASQGTGTSQAGGETQSGAPVRSMTGAALSHGPVAGNTQIQPTDQGVRAVARRRPAGPARARIAANDDRPSIGGLIFALQQKPSDKPYKMAMLASGVWALLGLLISYAILSEQFARHETIIAALISPASVMMLATVLVPIALFWFLAMLVVRAQELRLMSSAMTEVAVRLAEPDRMAEQQVASLGQTVRRQVAAMNDAISRSLGRAGELEALVHNEVSALERSYAENELRIRSLIDELASEREALTNNSERVSDALNNIGLRVAQDLSITSERITKSLTTVTTAMSDSLAAKGEKVTSAIAAAGTAIDEKLLERGGQITKQIVTQGVQAAERIEQAGEKVNKAIQESTDRTTALVTSRGNSLLQAVSSMNERIKNELPTLLESLGGEQIRLSQIIESAVKNLSDLERSVVNRTGALEKTLSNRTQHLQNVLTQHLQGVDKAVIDRVTALDKSMVERTKKLDAAFAQRVDQINAALENQTSYVQNTLQDRSRAVEVALANQAANFDKTFSQGVESFRKTTANLTTESIRTIEALAGQADVLKNVSEGLLGQVHNLIGRFENRGQSIMKAAHSLENSQFKIDSLLENRQAELNGLLNTIHSKADQLDHMMKGYSSHLEHTLNDAQRRARELTQALSNNSESNSHNILAELERLRVDTQVQTESAVAEMRKRFSSITSEVSGHINTLSTHFMDATHQIKSRTQQAAGQLDVAQSEIRKRIDELPELTKESSKAMRSALQDQLRAIDSLSAIANQHGRNRDVSAPSKNAQKRSSSGSAEDRITANYLPDQRLQGQSSTSQITQPDPYSYASMEQNTSSAPQQGHYPQPQYQLPDMYNQPVVNQAMMDENGNWSLGDLLHRASQNDQHLMAMAQQQQMASGHSQGKSQTLDMQTIARAIDPRVAEQLWQRYQNGERGIFNRHLYTQEGQMTFDEIYQRYNTDPDFMQMVDRYLNDFERLLREADQRDPRGQLVQNYLTSETGRVYLLLAHASGRLG